MLSRMALSTSPTAPPRMARPSTIKAARRFLRVIGQLPALSLRTGIAGAGLGSNRQMVAQKTLKPQNHARCRAGYAIRPYAVFVLPGLPRDGKPLIDNHEIGRASCRERVGQYEEIPG